MGRRCVFGIMMGSMLLLLAAGAMAQRDRDRGRDRDGTVREQRLERALDRARARIRMNGRDDEELSRRAIRRDNRILVPSQDFFRRLGGDVRQERYRDRDWYTFRRGGRDLRFRPGERLYYWGGRPYYWSVPPSTIGGQIYIPLGDVTLALGGGYNYDPYYGYGNVTLGDYGRYPDYGALRLTYPYSGQYFSNDRIEVQGYSAPYSRVRLQVFRDSPYAFTSNAVEHKVPQTNRSGFFSQVLRVPGRGNYRLLATTLDPGGRPINTESRYFTVR